MKCYADTGLLLSLYLPETTTDVAIAAVSGLSEALPILPLGLLELRNALNFAINRKQITVVERNAIWSKVQLQIRSGFFVLLSPSSTELHDKARELSDLHTAKYATRSLDLLHVAAALLMGAETFLSFDQRQRKVAEAQGLQVLP